jgi:hypothetical protein
MKNLDYLTLDFCNAMVSKLSPVIKKKIETIDTDYGIVKIHSFGYSYYDENVFNKYYDVINELRGLTFVENYDGTIERFLSIHKFNNFPFSLNESKEEIGILDDIGIENVTIKSDGSLIIPYRYNCGQKYSFGFKTKMTINSEILDIIYRQLPKDILHLYKMFIELFYKDFSNEYQPLFELISPSNQIVVSYKITRLSLIQIRNNKTGEYLDIHSPDYNKIMDFIRYFSRFFVPNNIKFDLSKQFDLVSYSERFNYSLPKLLESINKDYSSNFEGFVIKFKNGDFYKLKTDWYFENHKLKNDLFDFNKRREIFFKMICNSTEDDFISSLHYCGDNQQKDLIIEINQLKEYIINKRIELTQNEVNKLKEFYTYIQNHPNKDILIKLESERLFIGEFVKFLKINYPNDIMFPFDIDYFKFNYKELQINDKNTDDFYLESLIEYNLKDGRTMGILKSNIHSHLISFLNGMINNNPNNFKNIFFIKLFDIYNENI